MNDFQLPSFAGDFFDGANNVTTERLAERASLFLADPSQGLPDDAVM